MKGGQEKQRGAGLRLCTQRRSRRRSCSSMHHPPHTRCRGLQAPPSQSPAGHLIGEGLHTPTAGVWGAKGPVLLLVHVLPQSRKRGGQEYLLRSRGYLLRRKKGVGHQSSHPCVWLHHQWPLPGSIGKPPWARSIGKIRQTRDCRDRKELYVSLRGPCLPQSLVSPFELHPAPRSPASSPKKPLQRLLITPANPETR